jgi:hypothetical protein
MKLTAAILAVLSFCLAAPVLADSDTRRSEQNWFELTPLYTMNARNAQRVTVSLSYEKFDNVRIEEAKDFKGYTTSAELIVPFGEHKSWQARLEVPFFTEGEAWSLDYDKPIDIRGKGGVFDFASLLLQRELSTSDTRPYNTSVYFGYGHRTRPLHTSIRDLYNHHGRMTRVGFNLDNAHPSRPLRWQTTADLRHYFDSDDLNPSEDGDNFFMLTLSGATVYNVTGPVKPAFELLYSTDFNLRQIFQAVPVLIIPLGKHVELKGGYAVGHSNGEGTIHVGTVRTTLRF